ncbi:MAG: hypothetical protein EBS64_08415, partial [Verrucomicrobia bacterium]|nr:hypothetical protein [Verrucomicrobiota bacterium]
MSNAVVSRVGPPDFKSFRKKRKLSIGDVILWSESGKKTYQGKSRKKRRFKKRRAHMQTTSPSPSNKVNSSHKRAQQRVQKKSKRVQKIKLGKLRKKEKAQVEKRPKKSGRILRKTEISEPRKKTDKITLKTLQPWVNEYGTTKME